MHYGNMKFKNKQREEQAEADGTEGKKTNCPKVDEHDVKLYVKNKDAPVFLQMLTKLLI